MAPIVRPVAAIRRNLRAARDALEDERVAADRLVQHPLPGAAEKLVDAQNTREIQQVRLETGIAEVEQYDNEWQDYISSLATEAEQSAEMIEYETAAHGDSPRGHLRGVRMAKVQLGIVRLQLQKIATHLSGTTNSGVVHAGDQSSNDLVRVKQPIVKLPPLTLPVFDGDVMKWSNFWLRFQAAIGGKTELTDDDKFNYLDGCLKGKARIPVAGISIIGGNYSTAVDLLKKQFQLKPEMMIIRLLRSLKQMRCPSSRIEDVQSTYFTVSKIIRQLEEAGENTNANKSLAMDVLLVFGPAKSVIKEVGIRLQLSALVKNMEPDNAGDDQTVGGVLDGLAACSVTEILDTFREFLNDTVEIEDLTSSLSPESDSKPKSSMNWKNEKHSQHHSSPDTAVPGMNASTFISSNTKPQRQTSPIGISSLPKPCVFCGEHHFHRDCKKYSTYNQRFERIRQLQMCYRCLKPNHMAKQCRSSPKCFSCRENGHLSALCPKTKESVEEAALIVKDVESNGNQQAVPAKMRTVGKQVTKTQTGLLTLMGAEDRSILSYAMVTVRNPDTNETTTARLLFDSASSSSYVTAEIARKINLKMSAPYIRTVSTFASETCIENESAKGCLEILLKDQGSLPVQVDVIPFITKSDVVSIDLPSEIQEFIDSMPYAMADDYSTTGPPDILLGNDYFLCLITGRPVPVYHNVHYLPTKVGLVLGGTFKSASSPDSNSVFLTINNRPEYDLVYSETMGSAKKAVPDLADFWSLEGIGICDDPNDISDEMAEQQFENTAKLVGNRWEVAWPYNEEIAQLPTNYRQAYGRFVSLTERMKKSNVCIREEYSKVIQHQLDNDIIEDVPNSEVNESTNRIHYLFHHAVIKVDHATTKVRIVYDASAKPNKHAVSLNQCMHRGPVLLPDLVALIMRFRLKPVAITADIEKAFLHLSLRPEDRDVTRFLWFNNPLEPNTRNYRTLRFKRVPFGVISSPSLLAQAIQLHLKLVNTEVSHLVASNLYVDNFIVSVETEAEGAKLYLETKSLFEQCSMNMRQWVTNSEVLALTVKGDDRNPSRKIKILGLQWNSSSDTLKLNGDWSNAGSCQTKRQILKSISAIFDPTGIYQPVVLLARLFLRKLWLTDAGWDDRISSELQQEWRHVCRRIQPIFSHSVNRCVLRSQPIEQSVCVFCDASGDAFVACAYLRVKSSEASDYECALVLAKSRVAPREKSKLRKAGKGNTNCVSLPKLELLALTIGARMAQFVKTSLQLPSDSIVTLFSESTCALGWIRSEKKLPVFVKNRVAKIRKLEAAEYRHVCSQENAADVCSRGIDGESLIKHELWWRGSPWLPKPKSNWPESPEGPMITSDELRSKTEDASTSIIHSFVVGEAPADGDSCKSPFSIDPSDFSSLGRLVRITTICLRFVSQLWNGSSEALKARKPELAELMSRYSAHSSKSSEQLSTATVLWIKFEQLHHYADVCSALSGGRRSTLQLARQLDLFRDDDGLIRCGGRLHKMEMPPDAINPILLPPKGHLAWLIVKQVHHQCLHAGINHTLNQVRMRFWIPKGRALVRRFILSCIMCRKLKGHPFALPQMPNLPRERVARSHPFQFTGVDYLGPVNVKYQEDKHKYWIAVFTCFTTRAVHLENVPDCTAQSFLNAMSRFIARRGTPEKMLSDNAPQFKLTKTLFDRNWSKTLNDPSVISYMSRHQIEWSFIIELAPWQGGVYERLMRTIKNLFRAEVGRKLLGVDELSTLITEIESIVNSRPITYVNSDYASGVALRPVDFLTSLATGLPETDVAAKEQSSGQATKFLSRMWKAKQQRLDKLWQRWHEEYLLGLREQQRTTHAHQQKNLQHTPTVNEIVIVHNDNLPRGCWKLAKVVKMIVSNDKKIRAVELRLPNGQHKRRTLNHLYSLEIPCEPVGQQPRQQDDAETSTEFEGFDVDEVKAAEETSRAWQTNRQQFVELAQVNIALGLTLVDNQRLSTR